MACANPGACVSPSAKKDPGPRWVDSAGLGFAGSEEPLDFEPRATPRATEPAKPGNDIGWTDDWVVEPRAAVPAPKPGSGQTDAPEPSPSPAFTARAPRTGTSTTARQQQSRHGLLLPRLGIGLAQGSRCACCCRRGRQTWDRAVILHFSGLFLPRCRAADRAGSLGESRSDCWRCGAAPRSSSLPRLGFTSNGACRAPAWSGQRSHSRRARDGRSRKSCSGRRCARASRWPRYRTYFETAWSLGARLLIWAGTDGIAFALIGSGNSLFNWLRGHYPAMSADHGATPADHADAGPGQRRRFRDRLACGDAKPCAALLTCCTLALPLLTAASVAALALYVSGSPLPAARGGNSGPVLVIAMQRLLSRGDAARRRWRRMRNSPPPSLIAALAGLAGVQRCTARPAFGWTANRILAAAAIARWRGMAWPMPARR